MSICVICGLKQIGLGEEKVLAGFGTDGHPRIHIQSVVSTPFAAAHSVPQLYVRQNMNHPYVRQANDADADFAVDVLRRAIAEICVADHQNDTPT